ncbi:MAG: hypothetical protein GXX96_03500 [Planctomycetaceae bacterium]|nr:hypothetical protein [Planctomycetaceae bacterium]
MPIPFEPQRTIAGSRTCGAAALTMVYRSLGVECEQPAVWHRVAEEIRDGVCATRTHRLTLDASRQGLAAVTLQAERPAELLAQVSKTGARVVLNHRLQRGSHLGHYSVLLRFDGREIEIHDPHGGPNRVLPWEEFAELWCPKPGPSEIVGGVLVAIGTRPSIAGTCDHCGQQIPADWSCGRCGQPVPTGPAGVVTCVAPGCPERFWRRLFCPHCDWAKS